MSALSAPTARDWFTLLALCLVWGTSYILIKWAMEVYSPEQVGLLRLGLSAAALSPLAIHWLRRLPMRIWPLLMLVGLTGTALPSFLFPWAQQHLSSSVAGIFSSLTPLFTFLLAWLVFRRGASRQQGYGIVVGLVGAVLLALAGGGEEAGEIKPLQPGYVSLVLLACLCYATSSNLVANYLNKTPPLAITAASFFLVGLPALVYSLAFGGVMATTMQSDGGWTALLYVAFLAVFGTVLASYFFYHLVQRTGSVFASTVSYLVPAVALLWGFLDGEWIGLPQVLAFLLILAGVFLSRR